MTGNHPPRPQIQTPQRQQVDPTLLHTTGGRPWTMYQNIQRETPDNAGSWRGDGITAGASAHSRAQLTVVSYNVLADSLISFEYIPYCRDWTDNVWKSRPRRILSKVCLAYWLLASFIEMFMPDWWLCSNKLSSFFALWELVGLSQGLHIHKPIVGVPVSKCHVLSSLSSAHVTLTPRI